MFFFYINQRNVLSVKNVRSPTLFGLLILFKKTVQKPKDIQFKVDKNRDLLSELLLIFHCSH